MNIGNVSFLKLKAQVQLSLDSAEKMLLASQAVEFAIVSKTKRVALMGRVRIQRGIFSNLFSSCVLSENVVFAVLG